MALLERILSNNSEYSSLSEETGIDETKEIKKERNHCKFSILCFIVFFLVFIIACVLALVYYSFISKFLCDLEDTDCLTPVCPVGMSWDNSATQCYPPTGYKCCRDSLNIYSCFMPGIYERCGKDILASGVAPSPQAMCYPGYVWVPWRKMCVPVS